MAYIVRSPVVPNRVERVRVDMGRPIFQRSRIPYRGNLKKKKKQKNEQHHEDDDDDDDDEDERPVFEEDYQANGKTYKTSCVLMGVYIHTCIHIYIYNISYIQRTYNIIRIKHTKI